MSEIAKLRDLLAKATPGEWRAWNRGIGWEVHHAGEGGFDSTNYGVELNGGFRETFTQADAELIAAMHEALPRLLALADAVEKLHVEPCDCGCDRVCCKACGEELGKLVRWPAGG